MAGRVCDTRLSQSNLRVALDDWGAENLAPELAARARVPNNVDNDVRAAPGNWNNAENGAAGWTSPGPSVVAANANEALFVLSISELHRHAAAVGTTNEERIARDTAGTARSWRLRSPGLNAANPASFVNVSGNVGSTSAIHTYTGLGARPALWINL